MGARRFRRERGRSQSLAPAPNSQAIPVCGGTQMFKFSFRKRQMMARALRRAVVAQLLGLRRPQGRKGRAAPPDRSDP
jgi:hypothetical protein